MNIARIQSGTWVAWGVLLGSIAGPFALPLYGCVRIHMRWHGVLSFRDPDNIALELIAT